MAWASPPSPSRVPAGVAGAMTPPSTLLSGIERTFATSTKVHCYPSNSNPRLSPSPDRLDVPATSAGPARHRRQTATPRPRPEDGFREPFEGRQRERDPIQQFLYRASGAQQEE